MEVWVGDYLGVLGVVEEGLVEERLWELGVCVFFEF